MTYVLNKTIENLDWWRHLSVAVDDSCSELMTGGSFRGSDHVWQPAGCSMHNYSRTWVLSGAAYTHMCIAHMRLTGRYFLRHCHTELVFRRAAKAITLNAHILFHSPAFMFKEYLISSVFYMLQRLLCCVFVSVTRKTVYGTTVPNRRRTTRWSSLAIPAYAISSSRSLTSSRMSIVSSVLTYRKETIAWMILDWSLAS